MGTTISVGTTGFTASSYSPRATDKTSTGDDFVTALKQTGDKDEVKDAASDDDDSGKDTRAASDDSDAPAKANRSGDNDRSAPVKKVAADTSDQKDDSSSTQDSSPATDSSDETTTGASTTTDTTADLADATAVLKKLVTQAAIESDALKQQAAQDQQAASAGDEVSTTLANLQSQPDANAAKVEQPSIPVTVNTVAAQTLQAQTGLADEAAAFTAAKTVASTAKEGETTTSSKTDEKASGDTQGKTDTASDALSLLNELSTVAPAPTAAQTTQTNEASQSVAEPQSKAASVLPSATAVPDTTADLATSDTTPDSQGSDGAADVLNLISTAKSSTAGLTAVDVDASVHVDSDVSVQPINLEVLSSQRMIAPVNTSNGAKIAAALVGDGQQINSTANTDGLQKLNSESSSTDRTLNTLKVKMTPESLGSVTATMKLTGGQLSVSLVVETAAAYRQLHDDQSEIVKTLKAQGFAVDQVQISLSSVSSSSDTSQSNNQNQNQSNGQQTMQNGGNSSQNGSRQTQQQGVFYERTAGGMGDDTFSGDTAGSGSAAGGSRSTSGLYL
ncbi:flagellar hook-length control protein FliK [Allorhizobium undicola]|uniref:flagellar hook-length control protein FliK n=1 Tax=Allorhizobium undicola TaxID=78527 RepID=UPI000482DF07|nr:flagellar hook-length control protein FliK [Allorhizobium undicola]